MKVGDRDLEASANGELAHSTDRKIISGEYFRCPYRKPTQVDEVRILRRSRKLPLRN